MSLPVAAHDLCPHCGAAVTPPQRKAAERLAEPFEPKRRPGGRQIPLGPAVRAWAAYLTDVCQWSEREAQRVAKRVCLNALPARQRKGGRVA